MPKRIGKVFLSHSTADKPRVRRLARSIEQEGFEVWLDERELHGGDSLPKEISRALSKAQVVIIVVSRTSVKSRWLEFEMDLAAQRMIDGRCQLIPVVIDDATIPPELTGLLYVDLRPRARGGAKKIIETLRREEQRLSPSKPTSTPSVLSTSSYERSQAYDSILSGALGGKYSASMDVSATRSVNWEGFTYNDVDIVVECVHAYTADPSPIGGSDLDDWVEQVTEEIQSDFGILISERPIEVTLAERTGFDGSVGWLTSDQGVFQGSTAFAVVHLPPGARPNEATRILIEVAEKMRTLIESRQPAMMTGRDSFG